MTKLLSENELSAAMDSLGDWAIADDSKSINRAFKFGNFIQAFGFMTEIATIAEEVDHHPDWTNVYNKVDVTLSTHSKGGLTKLDINLAMAMNKAMDSAMDGAMERAVKSS